MNCQLTIIAGPDAGRTFAVVSGQSLLVGRGDKANLKLSDPSVSRAHLKIESANESLQVADQGSSSGTFVDGSKIDSINLKIGNIIQLGDTRFRIDPPAGEQTVAPSARPIEGGGIKPLNQLVGMELGPYKLQEIIGKGNSGMLFKAFDAEKDRVACIKVLSPAFTANEEQRQRFVRAMKTMLPIKDDRIISLYNAGKNGPYCWAAMELIDGENLSELIQRTGIEGFEQHP